MLSHPPLGGREGGNKTKGTANVGAGLGLPSKGAASRASTAENEKITIYVAHPWWKKACF